MSSSPHHARRHLRLPAIAYGSLVLLLSCSLCKAIERLTVGVSLAESNGISWVEDITPDGRYVVITSYATNLVAGDTNGRADVFVLDRDDGSFEMVSVKSDETQITDWPNTGASISNDGRYVSFRSQSSQFVAGDTNSGTDCFVRDRVAGTTERVSLSHTGAELSGSLLRSSISGNGNYVVFEHTDPNTVPGDTNGEPDVFVRDLVNGTTVRVSVTDDEMEANAGANSPSISDDGNLIAFNSGSTNLVANDTNGVDDFFIRNVSAGTTTRVSVANGGSQQSGGGIYEEFGIISGSGKIVAFSSEATNLVPGDTNGLKDLFVRDLENNTTEIVSVATGSSTPPGDQGSDTPTLSQNGRYIGFTSRSTQLDPRANTTSLHGFVRDRQTGTTQTVELSESGAFSPATSYPANPIPIDSGFYVFRSDSDSLVPGDMNGQPDVFAAFFSENTIAVPDNSALCASLKKNLKKFKKKLKNAARGGKIAAAKKFKTKIKKIKKQLRDLGC